MATTVTRIASLLVLSSSLVFAPSIASKHLSLDYPQAKAEKGGNGGGNGGGNAGGNAGGNGRGNGGGAARTESRSNASVSSGQKATKSSSSKIIAGSKSKPSASVMKTKHQSAKKLAAADPAAPAHPSMLGRWNAAKPISHPAMQAHIRNQNFQGTIGMLAAYASAQQTYNDLEPALASAQAVLDAQKAAADSQKALDDALATAGYTGPTAEDPSTALEKYEAAVAADPNAKVDAVETAKSALTEAPSAEEVAAATQTIEQGEAALQDLETAEANMEAFSNRSPWSEIRDDVRTKMGLDPLENDLATTTTTQTATVQSQ